MNPRYKTWGDCYRAALARGDDHGYAAFLADNWEERQKVRARGRTLHRKGDMIGALKCANEAKRLREDAP